MALQAAQLIGTTEPSNYVLQVLIYMYKSGQLQNNLKLDRSFTAHYALY